MYKQTLLYIIFILCIVNNGLTQEVITGLPSNPLLKNGPPVSDSKSGSKSILELPFFDDFSGQNIFPDNEKWTDNYVFINDTYTEKQITKGVATFDALDNYGQLYEDASYISNIADHLSSQPINLDYTPDDSLRLSFFFEPGGTGDMPEERDSLTLQFYAPEEDKWYPVWKTNNIDIEGFRAVNIRIDDSRFLKNGFRFRFVNYISLSDYQNYPSMIGNCDQWNIDYVILDKNRTDKDTLLPDVAFISPLRSLLSTHESLPWKQFEHISLQEMGAFIPVQYKNYDNIVRNVTRNFQIWDVYENTQVKLFSAGAVNIDPLVDEKYNADLIYTYSSDNKDSALFRVKSWLVTDEFDPKPNDTLVYYQVFNDYFAFDDGSSEAGYGINGLGSNNAMVACRFRSYIQDSLRAVRICFNDSYMNANLRSFDLMVWNDNGGLPGEILTSVEELMVQQGNSINGYYTFVLPKPVMVEGLFYVGWKQRSEAFLNAGFDINTPHQGRQMYWINGIWHESGQNGSLMIRPVTGPPLATSVNDIPFLRTEPLSFRPNPARDYIIFNTERLPVDGLTYVSFFDLSGKEIMKVPLSETIDISYLNTGVYIIVASRQGRYLGYNRLIKIK
ncbi:MAG TPA: hypothetical protein PLX41_00260 [Bacteroidales bacterium]|nr:hypothetical protein [Bacteroidales bacterium]HPR72068.1 hypothetical protein [Bacteroidales bacterium]